MAPSQRQERGRHTSLRLVALARQHLVARARIRPLLDLGRYPLSVAATSDRLTQIFVGPRHEAEIIRGMLESSGVATVIEHPGTSAAYPLTVGPLGQTTVSVLEHQVAQAQNLLGEARPEPSPVKVSPSGRLTVIRWAALFVLLVAAATLLSPIREWFSL